MTPEDDRIFRAFTECPLAPLEGVPTYEYMNNLNIYLNLFPSTVDCTLVYGKLGYLFLTAQPDLFRTHCGTVFIPPTNPGIHPVMPNPAPMAAILSGIVRTHKHKVHLFKNTTWSIGRVRRSSVS